MTVPVSVLILTKNEELDLPAYLDSVAFSGDIRVFNPFCYDKTDQIAHSRRVNIVQRVFDDYAS